MRFFRLTSTWRNLRALMSWSKTKLTSFSHDCEFNLVVVDNLELESMLANFLPFVWTNKLDRLSTLSHLQPN